MIKNVLIAAPLLLLPLGSHAIGLGASTSNNGWFWGGGVGASFGDVDVITLSPMIGKHITNQVSAGVSLNYTHRTDDRYSKTLKTNDFGAALFARYALTPQFFVEADYEFLSAEQYTTLEDKERENYNNVLVGGGIRTPLGGNATAYASALYNLSYDENDSPYDDPWVIRAGVGFGF